MFFSNSQWKCWICFLSHQWKLHMLKNLFSQNREFLCDLPLDTPSIGTVSFFLKNIADQLMSNSPRITPALLVSNNITPGPHFIMKSFVFHQEMKCFFLLSQNREMILSPHLQKAHSFCKFCKTETWENKNKNLWNHTTLK